MKRKISIFVYHILIFLAVLFLPIYALASVEITEVMCNPKGTDKYGEWVKIKNTGGASVDLTGWKFNDGSNHNLNTPPKNGGVGTMNLQAGETAFLAGDASSVSLSGTVIDTVMDLNNKADSLSLIDASGAKVGTYSYSSDTAFAENQLCIGSWSSSTQDTEDNTDGQSDNITQETVTNIITKTKYNTVTIEPPSDVFLRVESDDESLVGSILNFTGEVYDARGSVVRNPNIEWTFGDGFTARGVNVSHVYQYPGEYILVAVVKHNGLLDELSKKIKIREADISVFLPDTFEFVELKNKSDFLIDISGWKIRSSYQTFTIAQNTKISARASIRLPSKLLKLSTLGKTKLVKLFDARGELIADSSKEDEAESADISVNTPKNSTSTVATSSPVRAGEGGVGSKQNGVSYKYSIKRNAGGVLYVATETSYPNTQIGKAIKTQSQRKDFKKTKKVESIKSTKSTSTRASLLSDDISKKNLANLASANMALPDTKFFSGISVWLVALFLLILLAFYSIVFTNNKTEVSHENNTDCPDEVDEFKIEEL